MRPQNPHKLRGLDPAFLDKLLGVIETLAGQGHDLRVFSGVRDPFEQARLWRQSRTTEQIRVRCSELRRQGAPRIAACIEAVGPQYGKPVTKAVPGFSWHQHGEAADLFLAEPDGRADWDASAEGYKALARVAREAGLKPGRDFGDPPHVQLRAHEPHHIHEISRLDNMLSARFPEFAALPIRQA